MVMDPFVPSCNECQETTPLSYPVFDGDISKHGFSMELEIIPRSEGTAKIKKILNKQTINPKTDFPKIMDYIKKDALRRGYKISG